ncbi:dynein axonemal heavy chain 11 [Manacus candei]|uniref:dynein axonemal heavy chain 11 n=1 Tax=Manacus candei TaxID=415023 RepID=UPI002225C990|nr:dynein axonemal heavy chain 11 [Manacus candei]
MIWYDRHKLTTKECHSCQYVAHMNPTAGSFTIKPRLQVDLASLYIKTGAKNMPTVFLLTDAQVPDERFFVLINDLLASGELPDLFSDEGLKVIVAGVRKSLSPGPDGHQRALLEVYHEAEPKCCALAQAHTELAAATEKLEAFRKKLLVLNSIQNPQIRKSGITP